MSFGMASLPAVMGAAKGGGLASIAGLAGLSNPVSAGLSALGGLGSMFGKSKMDSSSATSNAGGANYGTINFGDAGVYTKPLIDLSDPQNLIITCGLIVGAYYLYKKAK